jgi:hypothetical protein
MNNSELAVILATMHDWNMPAHLYGTAALMVCAAKAIRHERKGEPWSANRVYQEYAVSKGKVQHSVLMSVRYALRHSNGPSTPGLALAAIIKAAYAAGIIDSE